MAVEAGLGKTKKRVLVVDDEKVIATTLSLILQAQGYEVEVAFGGMEAIETARVFRPECVISDVVMPDLNGIEAAIQIVQALPRCKVILFSGQATATDLLTGARREGYDFPLLAKPVHPKDLIEKLRETIGQSRHSAEQAAD